MKVGSLTSSGGGFRWIDKGREYFLVARCGRIGPISGISTASPSNLTAGVISTSSSEVFAGEMEDDVVYAMLTV